MYALIIALLAAAVAPSITPAHAYRDPLTAVAIEKRFKLHMAQSQCAFSRSLAEHSTAMARRHRPGPIDRIMWSDAERNLQATRERIAAEDRAAAREDCLDANKLEDGVTMQ